MKFIWFFLLTLVLSQTLWAESATQKVVLENEKLAYFTPSIVNTKYFAFEFGFVKDKKINKWNYVYDAYANAFIAEESYTTNDQLRAGALGFKGGVLLPTQPWIPLSLQLDFGYAKTALHKDPWFGRRNQTTSKKDMFLIGGGVVYRYKTFLFRLVYEVNSLKYFTRKSFFSIGVNF